MDKSKQQIYQAKYYQLHKEKFHDKYMAKKKIVVKTLNVWEKILKVLKITLRK